MATDSVSLPGSPLIEEPAAESPAETTNNGTEPGTPRSDSGTFLLTQPANMALVTELVPEFISLRLRSISCIGQHGKTQVKVKLQNVKQSTPPSKNLGDHTLHTFDFQTTVHNMTFDIVKIDVYDVKKAFMQHAKIGRAYLPLRELQKKVGNKYDNDGDDNTEPEQSVLSTRFDAAAFCQKHDDVFEMDLPLFKHGSYSSFGSNAHHRHLHDRILGETEGQEVYVTKGTDKGTDVSVLEHRPRPVRADSFAQMAMNGIEVGMITIEATLHFNDQTQNPLFAHLGKGPGEQGSISGASTTGSNVHQNGSRKMLSRPVVSVDSPLSSHSSTFGDGPVNAIGSHSDQHLPLSSSGETENVSALTKSASAPTFIPRNAQAGEQQPPGRILRMPSSPPNLSLQNSPGGSSGFFISPPLSPALSQSSSSPTSPMLSQKSFQWIADNGISQSVLKSWEESEQSYNNGDGDGDGDEYDDDIMGAMSDGHEDQVKGENLTEGDRKREEELMADIMANGDQAKKDMYLNRSADEKSNAKGKKPKFSLFSEQTRSAFKDIQLMYSSYFGHGWNLSRSEFWKGFNIVEQYYACHPTPTTNKAFDNIEILEKARHFIRLAIASYGSLPWVYFGYSFKVAPLNFIRFNSDRKNVMDYFKLKKEDMIVWHFDKRTALVPSYYIVRDPKFNALCIIIRGTFSITDAMTDLVCEYYPYKGGLVHKGIMDNARFVLERSGKDIEAALKKFNLNTIYCIGHSLGAGSASLLCSLLQDHFADYTVPETSQSKAQNLEIKAYLFAPPPICTPNLAVQWERTQIAFINENDLVCRLSYGNMLDLKELIKIAALESENPAYKGLDHKEKLERIMKVLEKAQDGLRAVNDIPRLVTAGTVTYIHKVYEDTPVIQNKGGDRSSKFGQPESWSEDPPAHSAAHRSRGMSVSSTTSHSSLSRSISAITAAFSIKNNASKHHRHATVSGATRTASDGKSSTNSTVSSKAPKVTAYQPNQPPVRLQSSASLALSDLNEKPQQEGPQEHSSTERALGEPIQYGGPSNARDLTTQRILNDSHQDQASTQDPGADKEKKDEGEQVDTGENVQEDEGEDEDEDEDYDEDDHKVYTTQKPKNGSKKKEIRIEFSDRENFMAIPLRTDWLWHHFPQQYDSRIERALAWAKAQQEKEEKKRRRREKHQRRQEEQEGSTQAQA